MRLTPGGYAYPAQLGFLPWGTIVPGVVDWLGDEFFGGDDDGGNGGVPWAPNYNNNPGSLCPGQEDAATTLRVVSMMTGQERETLAGLLRAGNGGAGPSAAELTNRATLPYWIKAVYGGSDCQRSSDAGQKTYALWMKVRAKYGAPAGPTIPGTNIPAPEIDITWPGTTPPPPPVPAASGPGGGMGTALALAAGLALLLIPARRR